MIRLPNITWLVALSGLAWLAMPADAAIGSITSDWNANEAALESVARLATDGAGSSSSTDSKFRWQPEEEPTSIDELSATLPADSGMSSNGVFPNVFEWGSLFDRAGFRTNRPRTPTCIPACR